MSKQRLDIGADLFTYMVLSRQFFGSDDPISYLGQGESGGKAKGLQFMQTTILSGFKDDEFSAFDVNIPKMVVLRTELFDQFLEENKLAEIAYSNLSDDRIAQAFQKANLPFSILRELRLIVSEMKRPLVVRSSSLLEDAMHEPFAGIYGTKMTPNNQLDIDTRFYKLVEAIKLVYASTFFKSAKDYIRATRHDTRDEKMAVIIQEIVGNRFGNNFYPEISGVAKSYNYYPTGGSHQKDGVVHLALGLGKQIVDGGVSWSFSPSAPAKSPPFKNIDDLLKSTQLKFWSVNLGELPHYDPIKETEFLVENPVWKAEKEGTLKQLVSTFDPSSDRIWDGLAGKGPRILTFAPILKHETLPLSKLVRRLMMECEKIYKSPVEIEFAISLSIDPDVPHRFGFLQVRPMVISSEKVQIDDADFNHRDKLLSSSHVLGNGYIADITDIIFLKRGKFDAETAFKIAGDLDNLNQKLNSQNKNYLLIGFGRWGTSDPWAGIPVNWGQISGARVIVESSIEGMSQQMSQASHFFHNVSSFQVSYFSVPGGHANDIDWEWLEGLEPTEETDWVTHVSNIGPLVIKVDGQTGRGIILKK